MINFPQVLLIKTALRCTHPRPPLFARYLKTRMSSLSRPLPQCWGHRGVSLTSALRKPILDFDFLLILQASAAFPENTLASFEAAIRDGSEGIESGNYTAFA